MPMLRAAGKLVGLLVLIIAGTAGPYWYTPHDQTQQQLHDALAKNQQLQQTIQRLGHEKRLADVLVTEQQLLDGPPETTLLFVEPARHGHPLPPNCPELPARMSH